MSDPDLTSEQIAERAAWCRDQARKGADALHSRAAYTKPKTYTDTESAARDRAKLEGRSQP